MMVYTVNFQARKSGQSQREEKHLETESYGSKHGMDGGGERGGSKLVRRHWVPKVRGALATAGEKHHTLPRGGGLGQTAADIESWLCPSRTCGHGRLLKLLVPQFPYV